MLLWCAIGGWSPTPSAFSCPSRRKTRARLQSACCSWRGCAARPQPVRLIALGLLTESGHARLKGAENKMRDLVAWAQPRGSGRHRPGLLYGTCNPVCLENVAKLRGYMAGFHDQFMLPSGLWSALMTTSSTCSLPRLIGTPFTAFVYELGCFQFETLLFTFMLTMPWVCASFLHPSAIPSAIPSFTPSFTLHHPSSGVHPGDPSQCQQVHFPAPTSHHTVRLGSHPHISPAQPVRGQARLLQRRLSARLVGASRLHNPAARSTSRKRTRRTST